MVCFLSATLQWGHNGHDSVSKHQPHDCFLNPLFRCRTKKTSKLRFTGLCVGNSPVTSEFPAQMASDTENVSIWWRHHVSRATGKQCQLMRDLRYNGYKIDGSVQERSNSSALAMEIRLSCTNPFKWSQIIIEFIRETGINQRGLAICMVYALKCYLHASPDHQHPWYWVCRINWPLASTREDFMYLYHLSIGKWLVHMIAQCLDDIKPLFKPMLQNYSLYP